MGVVIFVIVAVVVVSIVVAIMRARELERAKQAYANALAQLTARPGDNNLRIATLEAGRRYADLARQAAGDKGRAIFDEVALNNDLSARAATSVAASADDKPCPRCAETVKRAAAVCRFCQYDFAGMRDAS